MKSILVITDNPSFTELIQGCQTIEDNGFKVFIEEGPLPANLSNNEFTWIVFSFDNYDVYQKLLKNLDFGIWLEVDPTPKKAIIREPWHLITQYLDLGFDVYNDWNNLILRNFFMK